MPGCDTPPTAAGLVLCPRSDSAPSSTAPASTSTTATLAAVSPIPPWCVSGYHATRSKACAVGLLDLESWSYVYGVLQLTGKASLKWFDASYTSYVLPSWSAHMQLNVLSVTGTAAGAILGGEYAASGACFPVGLPILRTQPVVALGTINFDATYRTTATAIGAIGKCKTTWNLQAVVGALTATDSINMNAVRCDNATGGNPRKIGCSMPFIAANLVYDYNVMPQIVRHVQRATASGLPVRLTRLSSKALADSNRALACKGAPSIALYSCDEYPFASTYQGLRMTGLPSTSRRTFEGCRMPLPIGVSGRTGVSACMVLATEQNAQGGYNRAFNYRYRVLDLDPFKMVLTNIPKP